MSPISSVCLALLGQAAIPVGAGKLELPVGTRRTVIEGCRGRIPRQAGSPFDFAQGRPRRPSQARHGTSPSDWRTRMPNFRRAKQRPYSCERASAESAIHSDDERYGCDSERTGALNRAFSAGPPFDQKLAAASLDEGAPLALNRYFQIPVSHSLGKGRIADQTG